MEPVNYSSPLKLYYNKNLSAQPASTPPASTTPQTTEHLEVVDIQRVAVQSQPTYPCPKPHSKEIARVQQYVNTRQDALVQVSEHRRARDGPVFEPDDDQGGSLQVLAAGPVRGLRRCRRRATRNRAEQVRTKAGRGTG